MNIHVLAIRLPPEASDLGASFEAQVQLEIDSEQVWFSFSVVPLKMPGASIRIIEAESALIERFRHHQKAIHHVRRIVGQAVEHGQVHLPQLIAA